MTIQNDGHGVPVLMIIEGMFFDCLEQFNCVILYRIEIRSFFDFVLHRLSTQFSKLCISFCLIVVICLNPFIVDNTICLKFNLKLMVFYSLK
jgi:hypothetical protein